MFVLSLLSKLVFSLEDIVQTKQLFQKFFILVVMLVTACAEGTAQAYPTGTPEHPIISTNTLTPTSTIQPASTPLPTATMTDIPSATPETSTAPTEPPISSYAQTFPNGLTAEEYALKGPAQVEPLTFEPLQASQAVILARHALVRSNYFKPQIIYGIERLVYAANGNSVYVAKERYSTGEEPIKVTVDVLKDHQVIYSAPAGEVSPLDHVQGLWVYGEHWMVEYADIMNTTPNPGDIASNPVGKIVQDGVLMNQRDGFLDGFGLQLLGDQPFYFFKKADGKIRVSYAGQTLPMSYDEIPHYGCCSASELNPIHAKTMIAFFARRSDTWYYVEIGQFGSQP